MQMRIAPLKADILHVRSHPSPDVLRKFSELGEKIGVDLNRQGLPQGHQRTFWRCLRGGLFALWHKAF